MVNIEPWYIVEDIDGRWHIDGRRLVLSKDLEEDLEDYLKEVKK